MLTPLATRLAQDELMDDADLDAGEYARVLRDLARANRLTLAGRPTLAFLDAVIAQHPARTEPLRILDVGFGDGDMLRRIAKWARRRGVTVDLVGIDLNAKSAAVAKAATPGDMPIVYHTGDYRNLANEHWDIILSSLVTHHMSDGERTEFLTFMAKHATLGWMVNDLHRHRLALIGFALLSHICMWHPIVRHDGQVSVARSFRPADWHAMLAQTGLTRVAKVDRYFPFRLCVIAHR